MRKQSLTAATPSYLMPNLIQGNNFQFTEDSHQVHEVSKDGGNTHSAVEFAQFS